MDMKITVVGHGECAAAPDAIRLQGSISGKCDEYSQAAELSARVVASMARALADAGFDGNEVRTLSFSVRPIYEVRGEDRRSVFTGYGYSHDILFEMDADNELLGRALGAIAGLDHAPEFSVRYVLRDHSAAASEARRLAVKDAKDKAKDIAEASGVRLGEIVSISYEGQNGPALMARSFMDAMPDIVPESVVVRDDITMEWRIL